MTDVLVVGASVAGSTVALYLADRGYDVTLIDSATFPRRKACGEGLFPAGIRVLDDVGVLDQLRPQAATLSSLSLIGFGAAATAQLPANGAGLGVRRELLDAALLRQAQSRGVQVQLDVTATGLIRDERSKRFEGVQTDAGLLRAGVIVAADGLGSRLRQAADLDRAFGRRYGVSAHYELDASADFGVEVYFLPGYEVYLTPVGGSQVNVAVLLDSSTARRLSGRLAEAFDELAVTGAPRLREGRRIDQPFATGPFPRGAKQRWRDNLVLAGDAAGFFDGISGEGMSLALTGAKMCADASAAFLKDGETAHFAAYDKALATLQRPSTLLARLCLALAARPTLGRRAIKNLARKPDVMTKLIRVSQGEVALSSLRPSDAVALLCGL